MSAGGTARTLAGQPARPVRLGLASVADHTHPSWRAQGLGVYRFWRDLGYAAGGRP